MEELLRVRLQGLPSEEFEGVLHPGAGRSLEPSLHLRARRLPGTRAPFGSSVHPPSSLVAPVFEEDEWKLIAVGGLLGMFVGIFQTVCIFQA